MGDGSSSYQSGTSTDPFLVAQAERPAPSVSSEPPSAARVLAKKPKLGPDFSKDFEREKKEFLKEEEKEYLKDGEMPPAVRRQFDRIREAVINLEARDLIDKATQEANRWIDRCLEQLPPAVPGVSECIKGLLKKHFNAEGEKERNIAIPQIREYLTSVKTHQRGINSAEVTYFCGGARCFGNPAYTPHLNSSETHLCTTVWRYTFEEYLRQPGDVRTLALTLIHESLHRIYWWQFYKLGGREVYADSEKYPHLSLEDHLHAADSFAYLARAAVKCS